jgi:hypothetical protein
VAGEPVVLFQGRKPGQEHAPRFTLIARERERTFQHVAGRQHTELVTQLARAAAAVEHRDHGIEQQPRIVLEAAEEAG